MKLENNEQPLVSVYMPTCNRLKLLKRAVKSVLNQTYKNIELIIVDDCSSDGTQGYLSRLSEQDSRVRYYVNVTNSGACVSRNVAIEMAQGRYITGVDDDDYFLPCRIKKFVKNIDKLERSVFLASRYRKTIRNGSTRPLVSCFLRGGEYDFEELLAINVVGNQIFTYADRLKNNSFDNKMPMCQDYDLWLRLLSGGGSCYITPEFSYVVDVQHTHGRISEKRLSNLEFAQNRIVKKHQLDASQERILAAGNVHYGVPPRIGDTVSMLLSNPSSLSFYLLIKYHVLRKLHQ